MVTHIKLWLLINHFFYYDEFLKIDEKAMCLKRLSEMTFIFYYAVIKANINLSEWSALLNIWCMIHSWLQSSVPPGKRLSSKIDQILSLSVASKGVIIFMTQLIKLYRCFIKIKQFIKILIQVNYFKSPLGISTKSLFEDVLDCVHVLHIIFLKEIVYNKNTTKW